MFILANDVESLGRTDLEDRFVRGKAIKSGRQRGPSLWVTLCSGAALVPCYKPLNLCHIKLKPRLTQLVLNLILFV